MVEELLACLPPCLMCGRTDGLTDRPTYGLTDWLTDWRTDRQSDWLTDWLTDLLFFFFFLIRFALVCVSTKRTSLPFIKENVQNVMLNNHSSLTAMKCFPDQGRPDDIIHNLFLTIRQPIRMRVKYETSFSDHSERGIHTAYFNGKSEHAQYMYYLV